MEQFLAQAVSTAVKLGIVGVPTDQGALANYVTLPATDPKSFGNHIYVWETTDNIVPWSKTPDGDTAIDSSSSTSTQLVKFAFEEKGYIMGYAVAATPQAVCATVYMPVGKQTDPTAWEYASMQLGVPYVGTNLVQVQYTGLPQYLPATNKNWIGLWQGPQVPYSGDPIAKVSITKDAPPSGYTTIQGIKLLIGLSYSVGYFMVDPVKGRTSLAASANFTIGAHT
jgi:hypothetical protein